MGGARVFATIHRWTIVSNLRRHAVADVVERGSDDSWRLGVFYRRPVLQRKLLGCELRISLLRTRGVFVLRTRGGGASYLDMPVLRPNERQERVVRRGRLRSRPRNESAKRLP